MKPLIFILLATISAEGQSLADVARKERARQAQVTSARVILMDNSGAAAVTTTAPSTAAPEPAAAPAAPLLDPARKYADDVARTRLRVQELQSQESALLLQINDLNAQFFAPVTDAAAKDAAQAKIRDAQQALATVRQELTTTRTQLQQLEAQGPAAR